MRAQPAPTTDADRDIGRPLLVHHAVGVLVAVVLVGDVHIRPGVDVVTHLDLKMSDDVAPPADHAAVADPDDRVRDHSLAGHHPGRDAHVGADEGVLTDMDPTFTKHGSWGKGDAGAPPEGTESGGPGVAGPSGAVLARPLPSGMDEGAQQPSGAGTCAVVAAGPCSGHRLQSAKGTAGGRRQNGLPVVHLGNGHLATLADR